MLIRRDSRYLYLELRLELRFLSGNRENLKDVRFAARSTAAAIAVVFVFVQISVCVDHSQLIVRKVVDFY